MTCAEPVKLTVAVLFDAVTNSVARDTTRYHCAHCQAGPQETGELPQPEILPPEEDHNHLPTDKTNMRFPPQCADIRVLRRHLVESQVAHTDNRGMGKAMRMRSNSGHQVTYVVIVVALMHCQVAESAEVHFGEQIRPLFAQHCLHCHGPDEQKRQADYRVDVREEALLGTGETPAIMPGEPHRSELIRRVTTDDPDERMPPADEGDGLNAREIALLTQWVAEGAVYERHWAYQPIRKPPVPEPRTTPEDATEIDRFIIAALEAEGLSLASQVSKRKLIRRATFDLIGLPPSWEEVTDFLADDSDAAFARVIDRLLDSPRYGERWGRHWLDIARYADTHGGGAIGFTTFPFSYTYRDYVIDAFNRDLPLDRFITEQLAADQLGLADNDPALRALGFLTVGRRYRNPHDIVDDRIDVVTRGLLGLTVACARCHDHKYDAIPTEDYYSLYATFASSELPAKLPIIGEPEKSAAFHEYQQDVIDRWQQHDELQREQNVILRNRLRMQIATYLKELVKGTPEQDLSLVFLSYRTDDVRPLMIERWRKYLATLDEDDAVFGVWHQLKTVDRQEFGQQALDLVATLESQNGDLSKKAFQNLSVDAPRWNPRLLTAIKEQPPQSMVDLAEIYGNLFATVTREWLTGVAEATLEAATDSKIVPDYDPQHLSINSAVNRQLRTHLYGPDSPLSMTEKKTATMLNRPIRDRIGGLYGAIQDLHLNSDAAPPRAMVLAENPQPDPFHIFQRGNPIDRGPTVLPHFLSAISKEPTPFRDGYRRLDLARSILHPSNPLTRRVIVNWVWQRHFGLGLVRTPDDFGTRGQTPSHPDLLDYLATCLSDNGGSLKQLHRRIMLSRTYQQASAEVITARTRDPFNRLLWRMPRRRLDLEAMRDAMLAVSGQLDTTMGGRPVDLLSQPFVTRRSVYGFVNRDVIPAFFSTFDMANPSVCVAKRPDTTVPQQTLFALNSSFIQQQADRFSSSDEIATAPNTHQRITRMIQRAFSRSPTADELQSVEQWLGEQEDTEGAWQRFAHVLLAANEFIFVD